MTGPRAGTAVLREMRWWDIDPGTGAGAGPLPRGRLVGGMFWSELAHARGPRRPGGTLSPRATADRRLRRARRGRRPRRRPDHRRRPATSGAPASAPSCSPNCCEARHGVRVRRGAAGGTASTTSAPRSSTSASASNPSASAAATTSRATWTRSSCAMDRPERTVRPPYKEQRPMTDEPLVLGIETSCDETGVGIVRGTTLLADAVASSVDEHARFGGVVPEIASRAHLEAMVPTIERALTEPGSRARTSTASPSPPAPGWPGPCWSASPRRRRTPTRWASRCTA